MTDSLLTKLQEATTEAERSWIITESLLDVLSPALRESALAVAVPHWYDVSILSALLRIDVDTAASLYQELPLLSFVETFGNLGYTVHELTRAGILRYLITNQSEQFQEWSKRGYEYFQKLHTSQHLAEAVYHLLAHNEVKGTKKL
ncbi:MAG: hypothetical protein ACREOO_26855 [bacterium]